MNNTCASPSSAKRPMKSAVLFALAGATFLVVAMLAQGESANRAGMSLVAALLYFALSFQLLRRARQQSDEVGTDDA